MALALAFLVAGAPPAFAAKTDIVELINGDRITCEIKKLDRGKLTVKTDGLGTISIEWDDIQHITSPARFDVELATGERTFGSLGRGDARTVDVVGTTATERLSLDDIVRLAPLGGTLWKRLDGSISAGFNFTEANSQTQWTLDTTVSYRSRRWFSQLDADSLLTTRDDADRQTRNDLACSRSATSGRAGRRLGFLEFQQNEELSLNLRSLLGGGVVRTPGAVEPHVGIAHRRHRLHARAICRARRRAHRRGSGGRLVGVVHLRRPLDQSVDVGATYYALNSDSRVRAELNASFKSDIVGDLYWSMNAFESYNSRPPADQKSSDFGVSATMGWSF